VLHHPEKRIFFMRQIETGCEDEENNRNKINAPASRVRPFHASLYPVDITLYSLLFTSCKMAARYLIGESVTRESDFLLAECASVA
jgi:hypothetical protein